MRIETVHSERRWGHGRLAVRLTRLRCRLTGHIWRTWNFDWPYDVPEFWEDTGEPMRDPRPNEELVWGRGCERDCGTFQTARATLHDAGLLPGKHTPLFDNPIRRWKVR